MTVLSAQEIREMGYDLIKPFDENNLTPAGYDMTVAAIHEMIGEGELGRDSKHLPDYNSFDWGTFDSVHLRAGQYLIDFYEHLSFPDDVCGFLWSRSTLLRMGASMQTAVWDAGYHGRGSSLLLVSNPYGITVQRGARIGQMVFHRLGQATSQPYDGQYQGGSRG